MGIRILVLFSAGVQLWAQVDFDALNAREAFREGTVRFHRGSYNEAILQFQTSLSFVPNDTVVREWLGRAFYFSGFEDAAINEWQKIEEEGGASPALQSFIDHVLARQSLAEELEEDREFLVVEEFQADEYVNAIEFPAGVAPDGRGRLLLSSFGTNSINMLNQSGRLLVNLSGGLRPLSGPFDMVLNRDELYVTNFLGDFVSVLDRDGNTLRSFGEAGIGDGQLLGPQYISISREPAVYVSDFGNQRIVKFSEEGDFLFDLGEPAAFRSRPSLFSGFTQIAGVYAGSEGLYVGDNRQDASYLMLFDHSGNLLEQHPLPGVKDIEDIGEGENGHLLITTRTKIYSFDYGNLGLRLLHGSNEVENSQFVSSGFDDNGNLLVSDFRNRRLLYLSRLSGLYSGYQVEILRIDSGNFPQVLVEVSVRDILGEEVLGLGEGNFILTEEGLEFRNTALNYSGSFDELSSVAFIVEASEKRSDGLFVSRQADAMEQALQALPGGSQVRIFSAGISPVMELDRGAPVADILPVMDSIGADGQWRLDQALRLAGDRLLLDQSKREIMFIGSGDLPDWAFETTGINQTLAYLRNNHIRFNIIDVSEGEPHQALQYLMEETDGNRYRLYQSLGMMKLKEDFYSRRTGIYLLRVGSLFDGDFGRKYLPIEVEVSHFTKSGRDESGYFAPLDF